MPPSTSEARAMQALIPDVRGAMYVEFLLAFIPFFLMFLGMMQVALLHVGNMVVHHAATVAARAAVVVLPDDPARYGGEPVDRLDGTGGGGLDILRTFLEWSGVGGGGGSPSFGSSSGGARLAAIRAAASIPLLAVSPSMDEILNDPSLLRAVGGNPAERAITGAALYDRTAVAVTFPTRPGASTFRTRFGPNDDVTVRVTYLFHCGVPLADRLLCDDYVSLRTGLPLGLRRELSDDMSGGAVDPDEIASLARRLRINQARLDSASPGMDELGQAESPWAGFLTVLSGARFHVLRAEATLRNQGASYDYR